MAVGAPPAPGQVSVWAGVDVGGRRKGFHLALIDDSRVVALLAERDVGEATKLLAKHCPRMVAVDSPRAPAPDGERSREGERRLAREVCNIRYTPDRAGLASNPTYYEWIENGFDLYQQLEQVGLRAVECFPTASWTRWAGARAGERRQEWSAAALAALELADVPDALNQDYRDAIGAALTARDFDRGEVERFGDIVVPKRRASAQGSVAPAPRRQRHELGPEHALIRALRNTRSETELTRALAAVLDAEPEMAAEFVRLVVRKATHGARVDLDALPARLRCSAEDKIAEGRADLTFEDEENRWHVIFELKIDAGYGDDQIGRYLRSSRPSADRFVLASITRNVPTYGDDEVDDARWAGSARWAKLLSELKALRPRNPMLAEQWPLFLEVLEKEGSMGFTHADTDLFRAWAKYVPAREHVIDFVDTLRQPLLEVLCDALAETQPGVDRADLAGFASRGTTTPRVVVPRLGTVTFSFRIPAKGPERLQAGMHHGPGEPNFFIDVLVPDTPARTPALDKLTPKGFWAWQGGVGADLSLTDELLLSPELQETVVEFSRTRFQMIADSGILALQPAAVPQDEDEESGA
jgi:predicted nuclease with RNAse H fold